MFCSNCGTQLADGSQFCSKCGTKLGAVSSSAAFVDTNKVLKEGEFRRVEKTLDVFSKKNDGTLTLFCDRLEWKGKNNFKTPVAEIKSANVTTMGSEQLLVIQANETYKFMLLRKVSMAEAFIDSKTALNSQMANVQSQLVSWRSAIDKVCGRL